jgi:hypothetical protein
MTDPHEYADPADVEEQRTPAVGDDDDPVGESPEPPEAGADEADLLEQATLVAGEDDDYPNEAEGEPLG